MNYSFKHCHRSLVVFFKESHPNPTDRTAHLIQCLRISSGSSRVALLRIDQTGPASLSPKERNTSPRNKKMCSLSSIDTAQRSGSITPHTSVILASELY